jgi:IS30 family transposase
MKIESRPELRAYVETKVTQEWSPEEVSGRIREIDRHLPYVSTKGIYKYVASVYGRRLEPHLAYKGRKKRPHPHPKVAKLTNRVFIDQRPKIVERRGRFGDWEGDFIVSGRNGSGALLVLHERKARYAIIRKIDTPSIGLVHRYLTEMTGGIIMNTLTLDNDILFRKHEEMSRILGVPVYFCHPYHSWEKGGVENTNKLIRRYIPKGSDISRVSDERITEIQEKLNARPRKCLRYRTPAEVMRAHDQFISLPTLKSFDTMEYIRINKKAECSA